MVWVVQIVGPVLVTGGAGFVGRNLVNALRAQGVKVIVFDLAAKYMPPEGVEFVRGNLVSKSEIVAALTKYGVQVVFHVASPDPNSQNRKLFEDVNVTGSQNVVDACLEVGVSTLIYTSSASVVWQGAAQEGVDESIPLPTKFRDYYAETKARAEALIMRAGKSSGGKLVTISLRPHAIFGPSDPTLVPTTVNLAKAGRTNFIVGDGSNIVDWTYVGNVVHSHLLAASVAQREGATCAASGRTYFITNDKPMPFWEFMNAILLGLGYETAKRWLPYRFVLAIAYIAVAVVGFIDSTFRKGKPSTVLTISPSRLQISGTSHWYNISAAKRDLGYKPLWDMDQAIYLTLKAYYNLRNLFPSPRIVKLATEGNLVALNLVRDPVAFEKAHRAKTDSRTTMYVLPPLSRCVLVRTCSAPSVHGMCVRACVGPAGAALMRRLWMTRSCPCTHVRMWRSTTRVRACGCLLRTRQRASPRCTTLRSTWSRIRVAVTPSCSTQAAT